MGNYDIRNKMPYLFYDAHFWEVGVGEEKKLVNFEDIDDTNHLINIYNMLVDVHNDEISDLYMDQQEQAISMLKSKMEEVDFELKRRG